MLSDQSPGVLAVRTCLGPEARCVGCVKLGKILLIQDFALVNVGDRHLGGGY